MTIDRKPGLLRAADWAFGLLDTLDIHKDHPGIVRQALNERGREMWAEYREFVHQLRKGAK